MTEPQVLTRKEPAGKLGSRAGSLCCRHDQVNQQTLPAVPGMALNKAEKKPRLCSSEEPTMRKRNSALISLLYVVQVVCIPMVENGLAL